VLFADESDDVFICRVEESATVDDLRWFVCQDGCSGVMMTDTTIYIAAALYSFFPLRERAGISFLLNVLDVVLVAVIFLENVPEPDTATHEAALAIEPLN
jgi:hypothetical protein